MHNTKNTCKTYTKIEKSRFSQEDAYKYLNDIPIWKAENMGKKLVYFFPGADSKSIDTLFTRAVSDRVWQHLELPAKFKTPEEIRL